MRWWIGMAALCVAQAVGPGTLGIRVSPDGRFFASAGGAPWFWLGDTAWLLVKQLDREEVVRYLDDRAGKGFNVVQVMALHTAKVANRWGIPALVDGDVARPNVTAGADPAKPGEYDYWDHLDYAVECAAARGIYVAIVPAWNSLVKGGQLNEGNAEGFARFLARRYRGRANVVWLLGGDIDGAANRALWERMGRTLKAEDPGHLVSFHPFGRMESVAWFHEAGWLDFHMFQSGHQTYEQDVSSPHRYGEDGWRYVRDAYGRTPAKPVLDGEPSYEGIPHGLHDTAQPRWTAADCRRYAWWSVLAGAAGHTYGDNAVMQFYRAGDKPSYAPARFWDEAMADPGAGQMQYVKRLALSRPYFARVPDQTLAPQPDDARYDYIACARGADYAFLYAYSGKPFDVRMGAIRGARVKAWWYDPRAGAALEIGAFPNRGTVRFTPPGKPGNGNDWTLVLDDEGAGYPPPGR